MKWIFQNYTFTQNEIQNNLYPKRFGLELKECVLNQVPIEKIGAWAFSIFHENLGEISSEFQDLLLNLNVMEEGPEFAYSYEELEKIADDLILGREVKL